MDNHIFLEGEIPSPSNIGAAVEMATTEVNVGSNPAAPNLGESSLSANSPLTPRKDGES